MDPYKGGLLQKIITFFLNIFLYISYFFLKVIFLFKKKEKFVEPEHVIATLDSPIPSFKLAQALNPKTEPLKLTRFAQDDDSYVRRAVCRNPSLPREELKKLTKDPVPEVAKEATRVLKEDKVEIQENFPTRHWG